MSAQIHKALAEHFVMWHYMGGPNEPAGEWRCSCGLKFGFSDTAISHQVEQVSAVVPESNAGAWDEGFQAASDETPMGYEPNGPTVEQNPYRREPAP